MFIIVLKAMDNFHKPTLTKTHFNNFCAQSWYNIFNYDFWVQSQYNKSKKVPDCKEKKSQFNKYLSFAI